MKRQSLLKIGLSSEEKLEFEMHVKHNMKRAYFSALGFVGSHDHAIELSQEAFIRAYRNYKKFDKKRKFFTWYYKILKNLCLNHIRDSKRIVTTDIFENLNLSSEISSPSTIFERNEVHRKVQEAILQLTESERELIILKEFQELSYKEIADILEIPIGTVMSKLFYTRKKLAVRLSEVI